MTLVTLSDDDRVWVVRNDGTPASPWNASGSGTPFRRPGSVSFTPSTTVLVADTGNHRIVHVSSVDAPRVIAVLGGTKSGTGPGLFVHPGEAVADETGRIIVADTGNHRIQLLDQDGRSLAVWGRAIRGAPRTGSGAGEFASPRGVGLGRATAGWSSRTLETTGSSRMPQSCLHGRDQLSGKSGRRQSSMVRTGLGTAGCLRASRLIRWDGHSSLTVEITALSSEVRVRERGSHGVAGPARHLVSSWCPWPSRLESALE